MVITTKQYVEKLGAWQMDMDAKIDTLTSGGRFYLGFGWLTLINIGVLSVVLIGINSYFLSDPDISSSAKLGLNITVLTLQVILAIGNGIDKIIKPGKKAEDLVMCAKFYSQLSRELEVNIAQVKQDDTDHLDYLAELTNLFMREQLIHQLEPGMVWIGHKGIIMKNYDSCSMSADEIEWISKLINRHKGRKRERLVDIFNRVLNHENQLLQIQTQEIYTQI
jgi:hypothetical protein